jgi:hypothetical protein
MPVRPEDVLDDDSDSVALAGRRVRKGSVAAFVANARALDGLLEGSVEYAETVQTLRDLAADLRALGIFEVLAIRSSRVAALVGEVPA